MMQFNTPLKRTGFVIFISGLVILLLSFFTNGILDQENLFGVIRDSLYFYTWSSSYSVLFLLGFYASFVGILFSFAYDIGIGLVVDWVKKAK